MTFLELREKHPMPLTRLGERFGIPYRTLQNWRSGDRDCPPYIITMMDELLTIDEQKQN